ncbi:MAG: zinc ribbon domain-containing protein [Eubacteriales bacterium]|nr:zinc ribbon domain-containing protein [Eubacteriales bacterium]
MSSTQGYSITTRRLRLRCKHPEWLRLTQKFYNKIERFYYELLLKNPQLWDLNSQKILRELEVLSIPGRNKKEPEEPLPWEKVPLYFRRAAANAGIAAAKSHCTRMETAPGRKAGQLNSAVVYYKGMYRDFYPDEITLKVWDGSQWQWLHCRLYGRELPQDAQLMSPSVVFENGFVMLHVPVKETVHDTSSVKQRLSEERNLCSVQFTNSDAFAVGTVMNSKGQELSAKFWNGGKEYSHHCRQLTEKIEKSRRSMGGSQPGRPNQKYWMHLKHLAEHYAHKVSTEIVRYCEEQAVSVIVLPKYNENYTKYVMVSSGDWSPIHLSTRIRQYLSYKAWKSGIIVIEVHANDISSVCAKCGKKVIFTDKKTNEYVCEDGHRGSRYLNSARNMGKKCLIQFGKHVG